MYKIKKIFVIAILLPITVILDIYGYFHNKIILLDFNYDDKAGKCVFKKLEELFK